MAELEICKVDGKDMIDVVVWLADTIWREHYGQLLSTNQIDYMLGKYQSYQAVEHQIEEGYEYYLARFQGKYVGFTGIHKESDVTMFISKVYVLKEMRGKKIGGALLDFGKRRAKEEGCTRTYLTVNRGNTGSVEVYKKKGYEIIRKEDTPIGNGFVMNDFVMEYNL